MVRVVLDKCECCGGVISHPHFNRKHCSTRCRQVAYEIRNPKQTLLNRARYRANKTGRAFNLTIADIPDIPSTCPVLGIPITQIHNGRSGLHPNSISLNRIDPSKGYVKGNIEIISQRANHLLSNATVEELEKVLAHARGA